MRGTTSVILQLHLDPAHNWNVIYRAWSNSTHLPTSPSNAPATQNGIPKYEENLLKTVEASFTMRGRPWSEHEIAKLNPPVRGAYFSPSATHLILYWKFTTFRALAIYPNFTKYCACHEDHQMLCLPRTVTLRHHQILCLPRKVARQHHQMLRLPRKVTLHRHQILCMPRRVTELLLSWTVTVLNCCLTELLLYWAATLLLLYWAVTLLNCYFTELLLYRIVTLGKPLLYCTVTLLSCYLTELLLNCCVTEPLLYWAVTLLNCYSTELLLE